MWEKLKILWDIFCFNTLYFNFKYLPFKQAIRLPIWISRRVRVRSARGRIKLQIPDNVDGVFGICGMIRIGLDGVGVFDNKRSRSIWQVEGEVVFKGCCYLGHGCKVSVASTGRLTFGANFCCTAESTFIVYTDVSFGNDCLLSWDILVMDTDFHSIRDFKGTVINSPAPIQVGNHVWIGCRTTILKGGNIADHNVVAAGSLVTKHIDDSYCVVGKHPLQIIKRGVKWSI